MKADIKSLFVLDAILGLILGIIINELFAGMKQNYTAGFPGLPRVIPGVLDIPGTVIKTDNIITFIVTALPAIFMGGRIKNIFIWAFWTQVTLKVYDQINAALPK